MAQYWCAGFFSSLCFNLICQPLTNIDLIPLKENLHYYRGKNFSGQHLGVFLISRAIFSFASSGHPVLKKLKEEGTETSERQPTMILTKKIEILKTEICVLKKKNSSDPIWGSCHPGSDRFWLCDVAMFPWRRGWMIGMVLLVLSSSPSPLPRAKVI